MSADRYLLIKGRAGLGNRVLCALTGLLYARLTARTPVVDWSDPVYSDDGSNVFHRFFDCPAVALGSVIPDTDSVVPEIWRGSLRDSASDLEHLHPELGHSRFVRESSIDLGNLGYHTQVAVLWTYDAQVDLLRPHLATGLPELSGMSNDAILRSMLRHDLTLKAPIRARVEKFAARHLAGRSVGVHLRVSDVRVRVRAILCALDALLAREGDLCIFAATDNLEAKAMLERRYPGLVTAPHWYPAPGAPAHNDPSSPDRIENGVEALIDLYLLGSCDYLIGDTTSSFAGVANLALPAREAFIDVAPRLTRLRRVKRWAWNRYITEDTATSRAVHRAVTALNLSNLPAQAQLIGAQVGPRRRVIPAAREPLTRVSAQPPGSPQPSPIPPGSPGEHQPGAVRP